MQNRPTILVVSGHDPTGGAGIQADIETINSLGGHACGLISALTCQNSSNLFSLKPVATELLERQFQLLQEDFTIAAVKIGLLGSVEMVLTLESILQKLPGIPVVADPVLAAGGGQSVAGHDLIDAFSDKILPLTTLLTPNFPEACRLSGKTGPDQCASALQRLGCQNILITGTHEATENVVNRLYYASGEKLFLEARRLPHQYHGSGCTLSSAITACLARKYTLSDAVKTAQVFTFNSLEKADRPGKGQFFPVRTRESSS